MNQRICYLLVNFGGPRNLKEVESFLISLLTDQDVVRTNMPKWFHHLFFTRIAKKRAKKIIHDYAEIGGASPIYADTESIKEKLESLLDGPVLTFHRYLPASHKEFIEKISTVSADKIIVFPFFPQFTYATTGSIARFFCQHLPKNIIHKMRWIKSYPMQPDFIECSQKNIRNFLEKHALEERDLAIIFSAHGVPQKFIDTGDLYQSECQSSFEKIKEFFPSCQTLLSYQSKFGPGEWIKPYTEEVCRDVSWIKNRKTVAIYPLSFTSDHIETLFEIEKQYLPLLKENGLTALRIPAFNQEDDWVKTIVKIIKVNDTVQNCMLVRCSKR